MQEFRSTGFGSVVDRDAPLRFEFDGTQYAGYAGDTLASALVANGVRVVGRSLKYHRPRGIYTAGPEEPNALVRLGEGAEAVPNVKATEVPLYDGLVAHSQHGWPDARRDVGRVSGLLGPVLPPGFYYKTFMKPRRLWPWYERMLRRAAASARPSDVADPGRYDKRYAYCDVLVVGAGPAGLAAARRAAFAGVRVILADEGPLSGGSLLDLDVRVDGAPALEWARDVAAAVDTASGCRVLQRTAVIGGYGHGRFAAVEHLGEGFDRQRYWHIQAASVVLATGAIERPLVFPNNDLPGVMLASAAQAYVRRFGALPGRRAVVATTNDTAYPVARALAAAGVEIAAVVDTRTSLRSSVADIDVPAMTGVVELAAGGRSGVRSVSVQTAAGKTTIDCDLLCVSGGWTPTVQLYAGISGALVFDETWGAVVPDVADAPRHVVSIGAAGGTQGLQRQFDDGSSGAARALEAVGLSAGEATAPVASADDPMGRVDAGPHPAALGRGKAFVDLHNDVRVHDIEVSFREGFTTPELVKRYTILGMGTDQGKTSNVNAARIVAGMQGRPVADVTTTRSRPPYTPVSLGALAGRESGSRIAPLRRTPMHPWHEANGAVFMPSGLWTRPQYFSQHGGDAVSAAVHEARAVRTAAGVTDVSTLGKIDLAGPDVAEFLNRVYTNGWKQLRVGRVRYGLMLRDDGFVFDDGTTSRLGEDHYLMTTTTGNAEAVLEHLEFYHQRVWPELELTMTAVTEQWAVAALAGPLARDVLARVVTDAVSNEALPFMAVIQSMLDGVPVRISRISFSGELGYEIGVPADYGMSLWEALLEAGEEFGIVPYGLEAMDYLRIEKGHLVVGMDIDGRVSPYDLGLGGMCSTKKDYIGRRSLERVAFAEPDRQQLAGFVALDGRTMITAGAQVVEAPFDGTPQRSLGRITSRAFGAAVGKPIALGLVAGGPDRYPVPVYAVSPVTGEQTTVEVVHPEFYDPTGARMRV